VYVIPYNEMVDGYHHAYRKGRKVQYSRSFGHPEDSRCPECKERRAAK
jgi:hypothetical protein